MRGDSGNIYTDSRLVHQDDLCVRFPAVLVEGPDFQHLLHVYEEDGYWKVWLNTQDMEFTGLCIAVADTRAAAVAQATAVCLAVVAELGR